VIVNLDWPDEVASELNLDDPVEAVDAESAVQPGELEGAVNLIPVDGCHRGVPCNRKQANDCHGHADICDDLFG
jgi:hypothetical protein